MVMLYVAGKPVGPASDLDRVLSEYTAKRVEVELRDANGHSVGRIVPPEPICPWEPNLTSEEIDRRIAQGGSSLAEFWKRMGVE